MQYIPAIQKLLRKATTEQLAMIYHFIRGLLAAACCPAKSPPEPGGLLLSDVPGVGLQLHDDARLSGIALDNAAVRDLRIVGIGETVERVADDLADVVPVRFLRRQELPGQLSQDGRAGIALVAGVVSVDADGNWAVQHGVSALRPCGADALLIVAGPLRRECVAGAGKARARLAFRRARYYESLHQNGKSPSSPVSKSSWPCGLSENASTKWPDS